MPIKIPADLPAKEILTKENIFVMDEDRAYHQDIRPLKIAILNLMPTKSVTETQLLRLLGNTPLQVEITLVHPESYISRNTSEEYLLSFYNTFSDIRDKKFDGMVITGAPVEQMDFEAVDYWEELTKIMDWTKTNVTSTLHICWGAQAGLYHHYKIQKHAVHKKIFGVFSHKVNYPGANLLKGFDDEFLAPHSRHTTVLREDILASTALKILTESEDAGVHIVASKGGKQIFVMGHSEYDPLTLKWEYDRDVEKGMDIDIPRNYYPDDNPSNYPKVLWRGHANLLFSNWLNYYVYQETPYLLD